MSSLATPRRAVRDLTRPVDVARAWTKGQDWVWLDTSQTSVDGVSLLARSPVSVLRGQLPEDKEVLRDLWQRHKHKTDRRSAGSRGGLVGFVGYDGRFTFGVFPEIHSYLHGSKSWLGGVAPPEAGKQAPRKTATHTVPLRFAPQMSCEDFIARVRRAQEYIAAGDIYQVNLSYPWIAQWPAGADPWHYYEALRRVSPSPYGAFMRLGDQAVCSASPECFLRMSGNRIQTRPIKGTRPRGRDPESDEMLADELIGSEKERSELIMITDLERNDLGQVCEFGSVRVTDLLKLERFAQVQHLVSTVEGTLRPDVDHLDAFLACFPGGSITGAPKKRAREIIEELEATDRGWYTGAIGYFGFHGESQFSIAIRTAWIEDGQIRFDTGAGIVADSNPASEYEETLHKAAGLLAAARPE
jgi:anthranilate/para-aminobenzoate synthase component I